MSIFDFFKKNKKIDNNLKESETDKLVAGEQDIKTDEIKKIGKQVEDSQHINNKLNAFKATSIEIDKTNSGVPILRIEVSNMMRIDDFKGYLFVLDIYDVANNEKIDSYGFGSTFKETKVLNGNNSLFLKKNYSLESIVNENKHIQNLLTRSTLPSDNLKQFNLRTEFIVEELELGDGKLDIKTDEKNNVAKDIPKNHIELFPEIESIFNENIDKNTEVFFPVCSIDLGKVKEEWKDEKIHLI